MKKTVEEIEAEIAQVTASISWRWGECRRFQSNRRKIERRNKLIERLSALRVRKS